MFLSCIGDPDAVGNSCISWLRHPKHHKVNKHSNDKGRRKSHHVKGEDRARTTSRAYPSGKADDDHDHDNHDGNGRRVSKYTCSETPKLKDLTLANAAKNMQGMGKVVGSFTGPTLPTEEPEVITEGDLVLPNEDQNKGHRNGHDKAHDKGHRKSHDKSHDKGHDKTKSPPNSIGKRSKSAVSMPHDKGHDKGRDKRSHSSAKIQSEISGSRTSLVSNQHDPHTRRRSKV